MMNHYTHNEVSIQAIVKHAIDDATGTTTGDIEGERIDLQRYYDGETDLQAEPGRSSVVATKCRDVVRWAKPALLRVFLQTDSPVSFVPNREENVNVAEQMTAYASHKFNQAGGYRVIYDAIHDALVKKTGIVKVSHVEKIRTKIREFSNQSPEAVAMFVQQTEGAELMEYEGDPSGLLKGTIRIRTNTGKMEIVSVPPEEFFIDDNATGFDDFYICGHQVEGRVNDLVEMGFDFEEVKDLGTTNDLEGSEEEKRIRDPNLDIDEDVLSDPSRRPVTITEAYMAVDTEGNGLPQLYQFICAGAGHEILSMTPVDEVPFADFRIDPEPHRFHGKSLVEILMQDQDAATAILRGAIDNVYATNNPRIAFNAQKVNGLDIRNRAIGAGIRVDGNPTGEVLPVVVPNTAAGILSFAQYYDAQIEGKSGITRASSGLDADALRGASATAADLQRSAQQGTAELMARNLAEGGMRRLFRLILITAARHPEPDTSMRIAGQFVPIDPNSWDLDMDMSVRVGLGTGQEAEKIGALQFTLQQQLAIWAQGGGPNNGLVTLTQIRNTLADLLEMGGIRNAERHWQPLNPETEAQALQAAAQAAQQAQQGQGDQSQAFLQAEAMKAQANLQGKQMQTQADLLKAAAADDLKRDQMDADIILKAAEMIAKHGAQPDLNAIQQAQAAPRNYGGQP